MGPNKALSSFVWDDRGVDNWYTYCTPRLLDTSSVGVWLFFYWLDRHRCKKCDVASVPFIIYLYVVKCFCVFLTQTCTCLLSQAQVCWLISYICIPTQQYEWSIYSYAPKCLVFIGVIINISRSIFDLHRFLVRQTQAVEGKGHFRHRSEWDEATKHSLYKGAVFTGFYVGNVKCTSPL